MDLSDLQNDQLVAALQFIEKFDISLLDNFVEEESSYDSAKKLDLVKLVRGIQNIKRGVTESNADSNNDEDEKRAAIELEALGFAKVADNDFYRIRLKSWNEFFTGERNCYGVRTDQTLCGKRIFVRQLPFKVDLTLVLDLLKLLTQYGTVAEIKVVNDKNWSECKAAFVAFTSREGAKNAIQNVFVTVPVTIQNKRFNFNDFNITSFVGLCFATSFI